MDLAEQAPDDGRASAVESHYEDAQEGEYLDDDDGSSSSDVDSEALDAILDETFEGAEDDAVEPFPPMAQSADSRPHEEREDAFDYEHFILHSALGNFSRTGKLRRTSDSSTSSAATTRPVDDQSTSVDQAARPRANSVESISTVASFATAVEGEDEEDDDDEDDVEDDDDDLESVLYWDKKFNDGKLFLQFPVS